MFSQFYFNDQEHKNSGKYRLSGLFAERFSQKKKKKSTHVVEKNNTKNTLK